MIIGRDLSKRKAAKKPRRKSGQAVRIAPSAKARSSRQWLGQTKALLGNVWLHRGMGLLLVVLAAIWAQQKIQASQWLPIEKVQIEGALQHLSASQLQQQAMGVIEGGFFSVNLQQLRDLLQQQPWVESVAIRRIWPDTLGVMVIEKTPVAYWGKDQLLSTRAVLFKPAMLPEGLPLPQLEGPQGQHETLFRELGRMQAWLMPTGMQIQKLRLDARRSWTLVINDGVEIRLGRKEYNERLQRFAQVYRQHLQKQQHLIRHIDMRYSNGFAIAWKEA